MDLKGKTVLLTGASSGLGKEVAGKLAEAGAILGLIARNGEELAQVQQELSSKTTVYAYPIDITDQAKIKSTIDDFTSEVSRVDVLINNAGVWTDNTIEAVEPKRIDEAFKVNAIATINLTNIVVPIMKRQDTGYIFNVISSSGESDTDSGDNTEWAVYGATKWALTGFTRALTKSLKDTKIKVTAFHPGGFESNLYENAGWDKELEHNQPWMMKTSDVADVVMFALSTPPDVQIERLLVTKKQ